MEYEGKPKLLSQQNLFLFKKKIIDICFRISFDLINSLLTYWIYWTNKPSFNIKTDDCTWPVM